MSWTQYETHRTLGKAPLQCKSKLLDGRLVKTNGGMHSKFGLPVWGNQNQQKRTFGLEDGRTLQPKLPKCLELHRAQARVHVAVSECGALVKQHA